MEQHEVFLTEQEERSKRCLAEVQDAQALSAHARISWPFTHRGGAPWGPLGLVTLNGIRANRGSQL